MTFKEYAREHLSKYGFSDTDLALISVGWNARGESCNQESANGSLLFQGNAKPAAWANVLEWMSEPLVYPFASKSEAEKAADRNSGTVRPLFFADGALALVSDPAPLAGLEVGEDENPPAEHTSDYTCPDCQAQMTPEKPADPDCDVLHCNECGFNEPEESQDGIDTDDGTTKTASKKKPANPPADATFSVEPHGNGYAIYRGRSMDHHGANLGHLTECSPELPKLIEQALNRQSASAQGEQAPIVWINPANIRRTMIASPGETVEVSAYREGEFTAPLYTHPPAKVPASVEALVRQAEQACQDDGEQTFRESQIAQQWLDSLNQAINTLAAAPAKVPEGWKPANNMSAKLPEIGQPVMGYHPDWIDEDFCKDGIRECFLFGDGSEWQSARWDGYSDQWIAEDGAPQLWHSHPNPPQQEGQ